MCRKPRLNPQVVEQQQLIAQAILKEKDDETRKKRDRFTDKQTTSGSSLKLKNFDRNAPLLFEIFANGYSVVITEFQLKSKVHLSHFPDSPAPSTCSSLQVSIDATRFARFGSLCNLVSSPGVTQL
ncbi:hypothetical protein FBUS_09348 [Fasciolopsis buskii]|uniref:Uncharacterized protein n=1 Tax=Fasciolopsis buskii TaxID=27845 RepID=A0A8E0RV64_9TREM|nr:hypothetical protein FBUS_09348 [Fasciolopsis buski]